MIISSPARVAHEPYVKVLLCSTQLASRPAQEHEVLLDSADGLEWETLSKCDLEPFPWLVRSRQIVARAIASLGWSQLQ